MTRAEGKTFHGDLAGIRGEGQIVMGPDGGHSYSLDYELPPAPG